MTDSPQPPITKSSQTKGGQYHSGAQHPRWLESKLQDLVGKQLGRVIVLPSKPRREGDYWQLHCRCQTCGREVWLDYHSLASGRTSGCIMCARANNSWRPSYTDPRARILGRRYDAIQQRCCNPKDPNFHHYGGRGIKNLFPSRGEFISYVLEALPHLSYRKVEIDRIENNGHYQPGNLRLATRAEQLRNRRLTVMISYQGEMIPLVDFPSPYAYSWTRRLVNQGLTGEQILAKSDSRTSTT